MTSGSRFQERIRRRQEQWEASGLKRHLRPPAGIDLSSNDYLGLANHPVLKHHMAQAVMAEGCGSTASRLLRGDRTGFNEVEQRFADFKNTEASLYFSSGYSANIGVLSTFIERTDVVVSDEQNHASIIDGIRLSRARRIKFPHCDTRRLARLLREQPTGAQKFLVTESLFSMDGDFAPLRQYAELCRETDTVLIVDEAHAVGIYGRRGSGWVEETGVEDVVFITVNPAGKALGVAGAFVAGSAWAIDYLVQHSRPFIFSTAPPPSLAAALGASLKVLQNEPERRARLINHSSLLRALLSAAGIDIGQSQSQIIPIILGDNGRACGVAAELQRQGFDVRAVRPPAVPIGTARLRVSVNVELDESTVRRFACALEQILSRFTPCPAASL